MQVNVDLQASSRYGAVRQSVNSIQNEDEEHTSKNLVRKDSDDESSSEDEFDDGGNFFDPPVELYTSNRAFRLQ